MKTLTTFIAFFAAATVSHASLTKDTIPPVCTDPAICQDDPEMVEIDRMLVNSYLNHFCFSTDKDVLNAYGYGKDEVPSFSPAIVAARLKTLDRETPFDLVYNETVQSFIDLYAFRRRELTSKVLGMSQLYFPMFEEHLAKYDIPLEMKYLAVVESALNPSIVSRAGAGGLWQFMVSTGKMYGLGITSYEDERYDPYKATDAACRYLRSLYGMYNDWELALAAYNSGPGNVNKAIRRSGGKKDFWEIKPFLPKETQGYVPAFIAVNYVMNFASEYNIYPKEPLITYFETDTVKVNQRLDFKVLSNILSIPVEDLTLLNATYKLQEIPGNGQKNTLVLPTEKIGLFLANEDLAYLQSVEATNSAEVIATASLNSNAGEAGTTKVIWEDGWKSHKVRRGESLGVIASKYHVGVTELKKWNKIKGSVIYPGQNLKIRTRVKKTIFVPAPPTEAVAQQGATSEAKPGDDTSEVADDSNEETDADSPGDTNSASSTEAKSATASSFNYYTVQAGDTLWSIANKLEGVTVNSLKDLNTNLSDSRLTVGQKIKIRPSGE